VAFCSPSTVMWKSLPDTNARILSIRNRGFEVVIINLGSVLICAYAYFCYGQENKLLDDFPFF
jgi:hypothetical protein